MKKNLKIAASILFVSLFFTAASGLTRDLPDQDINSQQQTADSTTLSGSSDLDLGLGSEIDDYRSRQPQGSLLGATKNNADLFGSGGYIHPFISLAEGYSDNIFSESSSENGDFSTTLSTGAWLAYPPSRDQLLNISSTTTTPGGLATGSGHGKFFQRYQTYFLYQGDYVAYHSNSEANNNKQRLEGLFQYNLKSGISFNFIDQYKKSQDPYATGFSTQLDKFQTNLFDTSITYEVSRLLTGKIAYSYFWVDYDDIANVGRNRVDNTFIASLEYAALPKTTFITEYKFIDLDYDEQIVSDSKMNHLSERLKWDVTPKTSIDAKVTYLNKDFADPTLSNANDFGFSLSGATKFNEKSSLSISGTRQITETNTPGIDYILSHNFSISYLQALTTAVSANLSLSYAKDQYDGLTTVGTVTQERDDDIYSFSPGIEYLPNDWLITGLSYSYTKRNSNFDSNDYSTNSVLLRITLSI